MNDKANIMCHLCGLQIEEDFSLEHVPPKQIFPASLRREFNLILDTAPSHGRCNNSYSKDEEYFTISLGANISPDSAAGNALWKDIQKKFQRKEAISLHRTVMQEFRFRSKGGIHFPPGYVEKKFDGQRVYRVVWKIIRGLHYINFGDFLPEDLDHLSRLYEPELEDLQEVHELCKIIVSSPGKGRSPEIFDYKIYTEISTNGKRKNFGYGLLFWNRIMFLYTFHDPKCLCDECCHSLVSFDTQNLKLK